MDDQEQHVSETNARAGTTPGVVRIVLFVSLILVVVAFAAMLMFSQQ